MSAQTKVYYFKQRQQVVLLSGNSTRSYEKVYSKELTVSRGVDNTIEFAFVNQEQKAINVSGKEITARIIDADGTTVLLQKALTPVLPVTGIMSLAITAMESEQLNTQRCHYSISVTSDGSTTAVMVDAKGGSRGVLNVVDGVMTPFSPSRELTIGTHSALPPASQNPVPVVYNSSQLSTDESSSITVQVQYDNFTGTVTVQGSTLADFSSVYDIVSDTQTALTGSVSLSVEGFHPYIRAQISNLGTVDANNSALLVGDVVKVLTR